MTNTGLLEQPPVRPLSFGMVLGLHGAAIAAVLLIKGPTFERAPDVPTDTYFVKPVEVPPVEPPPQPDVQTPQQPQISRLDVPPRVIPTPVPSVPVASERGLAPPGPVIGTNPDPTPPAGAGTQPLVRPPVTRPAVRDPVRTEAQFDPRFASALQPPYPLSEEREEREGAVSVRVTIAPDGRVTAVERLSATNEAFWRATQRQALSRWRFKPATVDGKPVQSTKTLRVRFQLDGR